MKKYGLDGKWYYPTTYNRKVMEKKRKMQVKEEFVLFLECILLRIIQFFATAFIPLAMYVYWDKCTTADFLYLVGYWAIAGWIPTAGIFVLTGISINMFKHDELKRIKRKAKKFDNMIVDINSCYEDDDIATDDMEKYIYIYRKEA